MINTETQIGWQDYLAIVIRRRWFFAAPCLAVVSIAMVVGLFLPKVYRAETIMLVQEPNLNNPLIQGLSASTPVSRRLRILREELLGWTSLSRLVSELGLDKHAKNPLAYERLIKRLQREIGVRTRGGNLIVIAYEDENPKHAQRLVNTITSIYVKRNVESEVAETSSAISVIEKEMDVYQKKLEDSEKALREFKELYVMQMPVATRLNSQVVSLEVQLAQLLVENTDLHPTVVQVKRRIADLKQKRNEEIKRVIMTALAKGADPGIYQDLGTALDGPAESQPSENPTVRAAKEAYKAWVSRLDSNIMPGASVPQVQVVAAPAAEEGDGASLEVVSPSMATSATSLSLAPREEQEMARLSRDYDAHNAAYQNMKRRLERAKVTQRLTELDEETKFKILEPARLPLRPVRPNYMKIFFLALLLGFFIGTASAFVAEYLDQSFQSADDVQAALELPVVGSISTIVTEADVAARHRKQKGWITFKNQLGLVRNYVLNPIWARIDRALVRRGL